MAMRENKIRIILSYHRHNIEWRDLFVERLKPFQEKGPLYIFDDEVTDASQTFAANQKDLPSFNIIILFISQKYISLNNLVGKDSSAPKTWNPCCSFIFRRLFLAINQLAPRDETLAITTVAFFEHVRKREGKIYFEIYQR